MSRNNTGNPIGSKAFPDFEDNVKNLDQAVNAEQDTFQDRLGKSRLTWAGMEHQFDADQDERESEFRTFIASSGYQFAGDYAAGLEITEYNQLVRDENGEFWRLSGQVELPYTTTGDGIPEGDALVPAGDAVLRQELKSPDAGAGLVAYRALATYAVSRTAQSKMGDVVHVADFGAYGDGTDQSDAVNAASAYLDSVGGGKLWFGPGEYRLDNVRIFPGVSFAGAGNGASIIRPVSGGTSGRVIYAEGGLINGIHLTGLHIEGDGRDSGVIGVDFSGVAQLDGSTIIDCGIYGFDIGIKGSRNDRKVWVERCRIWRCGVGYYVILNHPWFNFCDFRANNTGLGGETLYDMVISNCNFVRNDYGIRANSLQQTTITGCIIFGNFEVGLTINTNVVVTGCKFMGTEEVPAWQSEEKRTKVAIEVRGEYCSIVNCTFKSETGWFDTAILCPAGTNGLRVADCTIRDVLGDAISFVSQYSPVAVVVQGCVFRRINGSAISFQTETQIRGLSVSGCTANTTLNFMDVGPQVSGFTSSSVTGCAVEVHKHFLIQRNTALNGASLLTIANNSVNILTSPQLVEGESVIEIHSLLGPNTGSIVTGNTITAPSTIASGVAGIYMAYGGSSIVKDNIIRRTTGVVIDTMNSAIVADNQHIP